MRKTIIFIMIFLFTYLNGSYGFINSRYVWWKKRYQTLNNEKNGMLTENNYNGMLVGLIDKEIERSKEILQIFESELDDKGSLNYKKIKYSGEEIKNSIKEIGTAVFYSYYLDFLVNNTGGEYGMDRGRELVKSRITELIKEYFNDYNEDFMNAVIKEKISASDWKYIGMELLMLSMEKNKNKNFENSISSIQKSAIDDLSKKEFILTPKELKDTIQIKAEEYFGSLKMAGILECNAEILNESWCWNKISGEIKKEFQFLKDIMILLSASVPEKSFMDIYPYYKNPAGMEKLLFDKFTVESPEMKEFFSEIDSSRKYLISKMNGSEDGCYFDDAGRKFDFIINKYFKNAGDASSKEDENQKINSADENKVPAVANKNESKDIKGTFENKLKYANTYRDKSIAYLKWLSNTKKPDSASVVNNHKNRLTENRNYIVFMQGLIEGCEGLAGIESSELRNKFSMSVQRTSNVYKSIDLSFSIDKEEKMELNKTDLIIINNIRNDMQDDIRKSKLETNNFYCNLVKKFRNEGKPATDEEKNIQKRIAGLEIELINNKIHDFVSGYEKLNYTDGILKQYSVKFNELEKEINENRKSPELERALKANSIFTLINNFDKQKFLKEYNTRRYLSIDLNRDMARLKTLTEFYKKNGVIVESRGLNEEIKDVKSKLNLKPSVRIAGWIMNECNFDDIDKNAVKSLNFIEKKNIWKNDSSDNMDGAQLPVIIENLNIALTIPGGWLEQQLVNSEIRNGILKFYRSVDGKASIYIASVDRNGMDNREISEFWMNKMGRMKIKERWGKKDNIEYLWTLSNSSKKDVMELYAITCNNHIILLSGITTKDKYNYFKGKIDSVFNSITPLM